MDAVKTKFLLLGLAVVGLGIVLGTAVWLRVGPHSGFGRGSPGTAEGLNQYGSVPDFALTERNGSTVSLAQLRGNFWIADFIYTSCRDTCPLQTATMAQLQQKYAANPEIQFVSFTVDPERDTPEVLTRYADKYRADAARWYFLTGPRDQLTHLIQQGFHLAVAAAPVEAETNGMIAHSPRFVLMDKEARIRGYYDSRDPAALVRLKSDIDTLVKG